MSELAQRLESYSKLFEWDISIRSRKYKWNDDKYRDYGINYDKYNDHYYSDDESSCYCEPALNSFEEGISEIKEDDLTMTIFLLWKTEENGDIDIEEEHKQVRLTSKEEWKDHVLDFMSDVEYMINKNRYKRMKVAAPQ